MRNHIRRIDFAIPGPKAFKKFIIIFYLTGIAGIIVPFTYPLFIKLIPLALILSFAILAIFHSGKWDRRLMIVSLSVYILSYAIEAAGVNTGLIFGEYRYGTGLGIKVLNTPLIIGLNWLILVYMTSSVAQKYNIKGFPGVIAASLLMVLYDIVLEQVAPALDMWHWENQTVPLQNYAAWFILAVSFNSLLRAFKVKPRNSLAETILICQFCFFLGLLLFFNVMK